LRSWQAVQFHAERTYVLPQVKNLYQNTKDKGGFYIDTKCLIREHQNFDESAEELAPLTDEEKKAKLEELKQRLAEKRKAQAEENLLDVKKNEVK